MKRYALALAVLLPCMASTPEIDKAKALGSPTAPIVMEVFESFDCPHCKALNEETLPLVQRDFVNTGKVYLVHREFPLYGPYHPYAREAAEYATAAGRIGKYEQVSDALFKNQAVWAVNGKVWDTVASVLTASEQKKVQELAKSESVKSEVEREYQEGVAMGVNSTPTMVVTHGPQRFPVPAQNLNYGFLKSMIDGMAK
ncbi:MAG TPA: thioredoxin domain-containing protein [Bryobacteraceae bacterium]|jgi:protein-disulfide isomerase|nr:thioredoxin domain-containing protein [Bryobacteraceae bacterium]